MRNYFRYFGPILFLLNCKGSITNPPQIIPKEQMVKIMAEVYVVEAHHQKNLGSPTAQKQLESSLDRVFLKFKTNKLHYQKSFDYYLQNPNEYMELNSMVIQELKEQISRN